MIKKYIYYFADKDFEAIWNYINGKITSRECGKILGIPHKHVIIITSSLFQQLIKFEIIKVNKEDVKKHLIRNGLYPD